MTSLGVAMLTGAIDALRVATWIWVILIALEIALPRGRQLSAAARLKGLALSAVTWVAMGATTGASAAILRQVGVKPMLTFQTGRHSPFETGLILVASSLLAVLLTDFLYYWLHRLQHHPRIWRFHAVHHAIEDLSGANYAHWTEGLWRIPIMTIPFALLMPAGLPIWPLAGALATLQSQYIHSPTRLHFGPLWRLVYDNRFHRIHHSMEPRHFDKNFGVNTPLWDWLFGTLYVPAKGEWPETGLADEQEVDGFWDYLWRPFKPAATAPSSRHIA